MGWEECLSLLESVGGKEECLLAERIVEATATGRGDASVQIRIAQAEYNRRQNAGNRKQKEQKETDNGQKGWEF